MVAVAVVVAEAEAKVPLAAGRLAELRDLLRPSASLAWHRRHVAALGDVALGRRHHPVGAAAEADPVEAAAADRLVPIETGPRAEVGLPGDRAVGAVPDLAQAAAPRRHHRHHPPTSKSTPASICVA